MTDLRPFESHLRAVNRSENTVASYMAAARRFVEFADGREASVRLMEEWAEALRQAGLKPQSVAARLAAARSLLGYEAAHGDEAATRTLAVLANYQVAPQAKQADARTPDMVARGQYFEARGKANRHYRALMDLLWHTGVRISEVLGDRRAGIPPMTTEDLRSLVEKGFLEIVGKGGKRRIVVLSDAGREALRTYATWTSPDAPFPFRTRQAANEALGRLGLPSAHSFRHAYRARLRLAGVNEEIVRRLMGHGPKGVTERYGAPEAEELSKAVEGLE